MKRFTVLFTLLALMAMPAAAQTGEAAPPALRILVIGDALGGGLGAGLLRSAEARPGYEVSLRFNEESGLARPEIYDWAATLPKILEGNSFDVIVVMLGANDRQVIRDGDARLDFGSAEWEAAYRRQTDRLLDALQGSGARVIWLSLPPVEDEGYDEALQLITALQRQQVETRDMMFLDIRPQLSGPDGRYAASVTDSAGILVRLRGRDGVSFFKAGNTFMGEIVLAAIASPDQPGTAAVATPAAALPAGVPLFGQAMIGQAPYTVQPEGVTANAMLLAQGGLDPQTALKTLRDISPSGSGAERLFRLGDAPAAPMGRADDFAISDFAP
ncbi:DUF459 domain-containing protein [Aestuariivirga sp.]|jgi:hypothetical protein|uniref:SGNH/GDSL hydrolase family protein n=1 Tax=Aestuariivirga sp. TaxID=2650926 RepID=UPI003783CE45